MPLHSRAVPAVVVALAVSFGCLRAQAQSAAVNEGPSAGEAALSREHFRLGIEATQHQRWSIALEEFQQSYALAPRPLTLLNVAGAQVETGHIVAGAESYRRFLAQSIGTPAETYREQAAQALAALSPRIARARITVHNLAARDRIEVDDAAMSSAALDAELPLDPGPHTIAVHRGNRAVAMLSFALREGERRRVVLVAPAPPPAVLSVPDGDHRVQPVHRGPSAAPVVVGVVAGLAVAAGVTVAVLYAVGAFDTGYVRDPVMGSLGPPIHLP